MTLLLKACKQRRLPRCGGRRESICALESGVRGAAMHLPHAEQVALFYFLSIVNPKSAPAFRRCDSSLPLCLAGYGLAGAEFARPDAGGAAPHLPRLFLR
jgi:hypothetical protein